MRVNYITLIKEYLSILLLSVLGCLAIIFSSLYFSTFYNENDRYYLIINCISFGVIAILTISSILFFRKNDKLIFKILLTVISLILIITTSLYVLKISGLIDKFTSIEDVRAYVLKFNQNAIFVFVLLQFLQVTILPIPSILTVSVGALIFGPIKGAIYSSIGIILGSITAFLFGKIIGLKALLFLFGKNKVNNWLNRIRGKDKIILILAFLLPFFPDDMLCTISGVTNVKLREFIFIVTCTRFISILTCSLSVSNVLIPYNTWWGIIIWILIFIAILLILIIIHNKFIKNKSSTKKSIKHY